jgi:hypothetical protein
MQVGPLQKPLYFSQPAQQPGQGFLLVAALLSKSSNLIPEPVDLGRQCRRPAVWHATLPPRPNTRTAVGEIWS